MTEVFITAVHNNKKVIVNGYEFQFTKAADVFTNTLLSCQG